MDNHAIPSSPLWYNLRQVLDVLNIEDQFEDCLEYVGTNRPHLIRWAGLTVLMRGDAINQWVTADLSSSPPGGD